MAQTGQILSVETDIKDVEKALSGTSQSLQSIRKQALGIIAKCGVKAIKASIAASGLHVRTGELSKAYRYKVKKTGAEANIYPKALKSDSTIFPKAMTLSYGHTGKTKRAANWTIKALGFVQHGNAWVDSGAYMNDLENMVDKQLTKYWG